MHRILLILSCCTLFFIACDTDSSPKVKKGPKSADGYYNVPSGLKGMQYTYINDAKGKNAIAGDYVKAIITTRVGDSVVFSSEKQFGKPMEIMVDSSTDMQKLMEVFRLMSVDDEVRLRVLADSMFNFQDTSALNRQQIPPNVKSGDTVAWTIKMVEKKTADELKDQAKKDSIESAKAAAVAETKNAGAIAQYVTKNKLNTTTTSSGLQYEIIKEGSGPNIMPGQVAVMNYTGTLLDGTKFDSNTDPEFKHVQPFEFPLGQGRVIRGWDEGVALMKKGSKAKFIIPPSIGYGPQDRPKIPANSVLLFDVELIDIKEAPKAPAK